MIAHYKKAVASLLAWRTPLQKSIAGSPDKKISESSFDSNSLEISRLKAIITNTYTEVLIYLRTNKGVTGDRARTIAYEFVAKSVRKSTGRNITADYVRQVVSR